jgi:hypothetical protein
MFRKIPCKPFDFVAVALAVGVTVLSAVLVYGGAGSHMFVKIRGGNAATETWLFPLDSMTAQSINIPGPLGDTVIEVKNNEARVVSSPCDNQTCVAVGAIHRQGQWVACLPNQILLSIEGGEDTGNAPDAMVW